MLGDDSLPPYAASYDLADLLNADFLTSPATLASNQASSSTASDMNDSGPSSPTSSHSPAALQTPPQSQLPTAFPDILDPSPFVTHPYQNASSSSPSGNIFSFIDDEANPASKPVAGFDPFNSFGMGMGNAFSGMAMDFGAMGMDIAGLSMDIDLSVPIDASTAAPTAANLDPRTGTEMDAHESTPALSPESGVNPQLVGTPAPSKHEEEDEEREEEHSAEDDDDDEEMDFDQPPKKKGRSTRKSTRKTTQQQQQAPRLTLTIAPVKAGGHGKARRGTVQGGGVVKKSSAGGASPSYTPSLVVKPIPLEKENSSSLPNSNAIREDRDDDIPADWRPPPEVFQKMSSKEKRQLRNKISARNFRVRRKGDIAERDHLLQVVRAQLGETQSENVALRQEIDALKKVLLSGRGSGGENSLDGVVLNLPPPAPLPAQSAAEKLAAAASSPSPSSSSLLTPNTQKDLPTTPRLGGKRGGFWGGVSSGVGLGGITPVHTTIMPEWGSILGMGVFGNASSSDSSSSSSGSSPSPHSDYGSEEEATVHISERHPKEMENINPGLNGITAREQEADAYNGNGMSMGMGGGLDGFADMNPFTMKTLDMYRMHLWGRMAAQYQQHQQHQQRTPAAAKPLTGLASSLRPAYFAPSAKGNVSPASASPPPPYTPYAHGHSSGAMVGGPLSALLMGKSIPICYPQSSKPPSYYSGSTKQTVKEEEKDVTMKQYAQFQRDREREVQQNQTDAVVAALATQTVFRRLGSAFWEAFAGSPSPSSSSSAGSSTNSSLPRHFVASKWDVEKMQKVLEGKAVLKVVDIEPTPVHTEKRERREVKREMKGTVTHQREEGPAVKCLSQMLESLALK
nr:bZIP transcription factor [Pleurotus ostreatus]